MVVAVKRDQFRMIGGVLVRREEAAIAIRIDFDQFVRGRHGEALEELSVFVEPERLRMLFLVDDVRARSGRNHEGTRA